MWEKNLIQKEQDGQCNIVTHFSLCCESRSLLELTAVFNVYFENSTSEKIFKVKDKYSKTQVFII